MTLTPLKVAFTSFVELTPDMMENADFKRGTEDARRGAPPPKRDAYLPYRIGYAHYLQRMSPQHGSPLILEGTEPIVVAARDTIKEALCG